MVSKQIRTHTHEHGRVFAQVEQFQGRAHLALQPVGGGPAHRFPLEEPEAEDLLQDYPELRQVLEEEKAEPEEKPERPERARRQASGT